MNQIFPIPLTQLAHSFPSLKHAPLLDPEHLWEWARSGKSGGEFQAAVFILNVWNASNDTPWPRFDVFAAYAVWDEHHMHAFQTWAVAPWAP